MQDRLTFDKDARICADGALVAEVFAARTGIQDYAGREVDPDGKRFEADQAVKVYRPEGEVFKSDSLATFAAAPVTVNHPTEAVDAKNWKSHGVGEINGDVVRDGDRVRVPIIVRDAQAVTKATTTHKQLSMGYATELVFPSDGKHPDGTACDAYQTNLRINHIALVPAARGGPELRVVDERPNHKTKDGGGTMPHTLTVDGLQVPNVSDEAKACIEKLQGQLSDAQSETAKVQAEAKTAADTALAEKTALEKKLSDAEAVDLDQMVADRANLVAKAKSLKADITIDGQSNADIRKAIVTAELGDAAKDYTEAQVTAAFDVISKSIKADDQKVFPIGQTIPANDAEKAITDLRAQRNVALANAHKGGK